MPRSASKGSGVVAHTFACALCAAEAETVTLVPAGVAQRFGGSPYPMVMARPPRAGAITFNDGTSMVVLDPEPFALVRQALERGDAAALHAAQPLWVVRYCPECGRHYCKRHWKLQVTIPPWGDSYSMDFVTYGTCPAGHRRVVDE